MARYTGATCRHCRREKMKLFLKGDRCYSEKCAFERRATPPGQHGQARVRKVSDYAIQLREKQKVKRMYGMLEGQFRKVFKKSEQAKGVTGEVLLQFIERRLDNALFRIGFASSRNQARQLVRHNHILINGKKVNIPSYLLSIDDVVTVKEKSRKLDGIKDSLEAANRRGVPAWVELDAANFSGKIKALPDRQDITMPIQEQLIVELYSK